MGTGHPPTGQPPASGSVITGPIGTGAPTIDPGWAVVGSMTIGPEITPGAGGTVTTGPLGRGAAAGTGRVPGTAGPDDSETAPFGITFGMSNPTAGASSGAWARTVVGT